MEGVTDGPCMRGSKVPEKCVNRGDILAKKDFVHLENETQRY